MRRVLLVADVAAAVLLTLLFAMSVHSTIEYTTPDELKDICIEDGAVNIGADLPTEGWIIRMGPGWVRGWHFEWSKNSVLYDLRWLDWAPRFDYERSDMTYIRATVPIWIPLALVLLPIGLAWLRRRRAPIGPLCETCGYNLTGNVSGRCPECGETIQPQADKRNG
jgi:hypothetical protein